MTGLEGREWVLFLENLNVSRDEVEGNIEIRGKQNALFPKDQSLRDLSYSKTKQKQILKNAQRFQRQHQATSDHVQQRSTFRG